MPDPPEQKQLDEARLRRRLADEQFRRRLAEVATRELDRVPKRFIWLVASPAVLGAALLIFVVLAWSVFGLVGSSGTTATALVVSGLLVLVPSVLAAWQKEDAAEYAQRVYEQAESVLTAASPPQLPPAPVAVDSSSDGTGASPTP